MIYKSLWFFWIFFWIHCTRQVIIKGRRKIHPLEKLTNKTQILQKIYASTWFRPFATLGGLCSFLLLLLFRLRSQAFSLRNRGILLLSTAACSYGTYYFRLPFVMMNMENISVESGNKFCGPFQILCFWLLLFSYLAYDLNLNPNFYLYLR